MKSIEEITLLFVDDEQDARTIIRFYLDLIGVRHIHQASSYQEALQLVEQISFDVALLDIYLGNSKKNGVDLAECIKEIQPATQLLFLTSHFDEETYQRARRVQPVQFLNKSLSKVKLTQAINAALQVQLTQDTPVGKYDKPPANNQVFFKVGSQYKVIPTQDISFFFSKEKHIFGKVSTRDYPVDVSLKTLESSLYPKFLRCHKAYLVNRTYIKAINYKEHYVLLNTNEQIPIGKVYRQGFLAELNILK